MNRDRLFLQQISLQADLTYEDATRLGTWAAAAGALRGSRSQMKHLERIANSTLKVSDVLDYLKKQTAKETDNGKGWRHRQGEQTLGPALISFISENLLKRRDYVAEGVAAMLGQEPLTELEKQQTHLALIREFVRQVAAQYELEVNRT